MVTREKVKRLKQLRHQLGWSEELCAHRLGVTYSTLNRWERGECVPKSQAVLKAIDDFLLRHGTFGTSTPSEQDRSTRRETG